MPTRITGLASGLDVDSLVKTSMKPYQMKADTEKQKKQVLLWKQEQYQKIMSDVTSFYNKYLTTSGSNSLFSAGAYNTTKFTAENSDAVSVTATGSATQENYKVTVTQLATKASTTLGDAGLATAVANNKNAISATATTAIAGQSITFAVNDNTGARYDQTTLEGNLDTAIQNKVNALTTQMNAETDQTKKDALQQTITNLNNVKASSNSNKDGIINNSDLDSATQIKMNFTKEDGTTTSVAFNVVSKVSDAVNYSKTLSNYNAANTTDVSATYSDFSKGLVFTGKEGGVGSFTITDAGGTSTLAQGTSKKLNAVIENSKGEKYVIDNNTTQTTEIKNNKITLDGVAFSFNEVTPVRTDAAGNKLDSSGNVTTDPTKYDYSVKITGDKDVTALKDKIKSFINDYNTLLGSINTKIYETYDKDYQPLTDEQRSSMSDSQIQKWETKAQTGLLRKDNDLISMADSMKDAMSTFMYSSKIDLESIGISPKKNEWTDKNGLYDVDDEKLTKALEDNFDGIKDLFFKNAAADDTSNSGIVPKMRKVLTDNVVDISSVFNKKAGGGIYLLTNDLTKELDDKTKLIKQLNKDLTERENSFYSKYSKLESALAKAQSQQTSMSSLFGGN